MRRDLIAVAARQLGIRRRKYTGGLFESRQVVRLEIDELVRRTATFVWGVLGALIALGLLLAVISGLYVAATWLLPGLPSLESLGDDTDLPWGKIAAAGAGAAALLNAPNLIGVSVNRSSPSQDDEFAHNLKRLILEAEVPRALRMSRYIRWLENWIRDQAGRKVVFFIDELDRASDGEVLSTLTALQTQFEGAGVSVVVAADREVLEKALASAQHQAGPERDWSPYLSRPDAFFDKVFQHTFTLPPLRSERIASYVRSLLDNRAGVWGDLFQEGVTDDVIYALIPGHVQSPRRIKVLLNAYATQTRVAEARGLPTNQLRTDLAQWCVLQLEFPSFARDLRTEPRLKSLMREGTKHAGVRGRLLERHTKTAEPATDATISEWLDWTERQHLAAYLDRVAHLPDPPLELLYLESAGTAIGRFSPEVAAALDNAADVDPSVTLSRLVDLDSITCARAARYLAENSRTPISFGMDRLITVMSRLIERLEPTPLTDLATFLEAYRPYVAGRPLPRPARAACLRVMLEANDPAGTDAVFRNIGEDEMQDDLLALLHDFHEPHERGPGALEAFALKVHECMVPEVLQLIVSRGLWALLSRCVKVDALAMLEVAIADEDSATALIAGARQCSREDCLALANAVRAILERGEPTPACSIGIATSDKLDERDRAAMAAMVLVRDGTSDLKTWAPFLTVAPDDPEQLEVLATALTERMNEAMNDEEWSGLRTALERLARLGAGPAVTRGCAAHLEGSPWGATTDAARRLVDAVRVVELAGALDSQAAAAMAVRELAAAAPLLLDGMVEFGHYMRLTEFLDPGDPPVTLDQALSIDTPGPPMLRALRARLALRRLVPTRLPSITPASLGRQVRACVDGGADDELAKSLVAEWLSSPRSDREVQSFLRGSNRIWQGEFAKWFQSATRTQATNVWIDLVERGFKAGVLARMGRAQELDGARLEKSLRKLAQSEDEDVRRKAVDAVKALPASRSDTRRVAQFVAADIAHRSLADRAEAVRLVGDRPPSRLMADARDRLATIPFSAWTRRQDREFAKRLGIRKRRRKSRRGRTP